MGSRAALGRYWSSFSYVGLAVSTLFFAASLTPSLLPRHFAVQGVLSGLALAVGYGTGVFIVWLWLYLEIPQPSGPVQGISKRITTIAVTVLALLFLWWDSVWQSSIRVRMEMEPVSTAYPWRVALIAVLVGATLIAASRAIGWTWWFLGRQIQRILPRRVAYFLSALLVGIGLFLLINDVFARAALSVADAVFREIDGVVDYGIEKPKISTASGSDSSLIPWDSIGAQGKNFIVQGPTKSQIGEFSGKEALQPLRVYVGVRTKESLEERAELALRELQRVRGFERSVLIVATPTGTGWLDPGAVDTLEYLHGGDTAIVSIQYSYLPSWITILVDPNRSRAAAQILFDKIYSHWRTLPKDNRPKLYLHGLSLGSLGSEESGDLLTIFEDPIQGAVWSGPPFPSRIWARATRYRNPDTPMWLPRFRDGSMLRFTGRECSLDAAGERWGPMRFVYIQHASDPMCFFSKDILYRRPQWLVGERGPDVSPYLRWCPIVTFLQVGFDLPMATSVPIGYGHNYAPSSYIDAWIAVTQPPNWTADQTKRLKNLFVK